MEKHIVNYNRIKLHCNKNNCILLTNFEDFEKKREAVHNTSYLFVRIDFIGICGHNSSAIVTNFISRKTGIRCKGCLKNDIKNKLKNIGKETNIIESNSINIIIDYLRDRYDIIRTKEACRADLVIKLKNDINYIPIQIKSTIKLSSNNLYSFRCINKNYSNMLILCICISEKKLWIIPHDDIKHIQTLNISKKSKYNKYLVEDNNLLYEYINKYSYKYLTNNLSELITPLTPLQQREQEYTKKRETFISFLEYKYPDVQNTSTDFRINGKNIQEKVAGHPKNKNENTITFILSSNNGKTSNGIRSFRTYRLGENDYYWIHSNIDNRFWIIPEIILYKKNYISNTNETKNRKTVYINQNSVWIKDYEYNYDNINRDKIIKLFL
jgi:hypothetical protein